MHLNVLLTKDSMNGQCFQKNKLSYSLKVTICVFILLFTFSERTYSLDLELSKTGLPKYQVQVQKYTDNNPTYKIVTFAIANNGNIAIGMANGIIDIYNENMNFLYEYSVSYLEEYYYIQWKESNLVVYNLRYKVAQEINTNGEIMEYYNIPQTYHNQQNINLLSRENSIRYNDETYFQTDTQIIKINSQ